MKEILAIATVVMVGFSVVHAGNRENELTGIYHKSSGKQSARLEIDGHGTIKQITVAGACLKDVPDGSRLWVKGQINTWIQGSNNADQKPSDGEDITQQQQPTQWQVVMVVNQCQRISEAFEDPNRTSDSSHAEWGVHGPKRILALAKLARLAGAEFTPNELDALEEAYPALVKMADHKMVVDKFWEVVRDEKPQEIEWMKAKELILGGQIRTAMQSHSLSVHLIAWDGSTYTTKEERIDQLLHVVRQVDPKGVFINYATE